MSGVVLSELRKRYAITFEDDNWKPETCWGPLEPISVADVDHWCRELGASPTQLYDCLGLELAHGYHSRELTFGFCNVVMSELYNVSISRDEAFPELAWRVFDAFDSGTAHLSAARDDDPAADYTQPLIQKIVAERPLRRRS